MNTLTIDFDQLRMLAGDEPEFFAEILGMILDQSPGVMDQMQALLAHQEYHTLGAVAHKYKSSINILNNDDIAHLLKDIEITAMSDDNKAMLPELVGSFLQVCTQMLQQIQAELDKLPA
ncbi:MAG: hypothetical protein OHK0039_31070 [Bacteroidia bacterium]